MNILITGVGGQGSLLASRILGSVFTQQGLEVKVSEVHGMSQRGGGVVTTVRAGKSVYSPLITDGEADLLIALEQMEALRWLHTLSPSGKAAVNTYIIPPLPVLTGASEYPQDIESAFDPSRSIFFNAVKLAEEAGSIKSVNVVMLGAVSVWLNIGPELWRAALTDCVKPKLLAVNETAFELGRQMALRS